MAADFGCVIPPPSAGHYMSWTSYVACLELERAHVEGQPSGSDVEKVCRISEVDGGITEAEWWAVAEHDPAEQRDFLASLPPPADPVDVDQAIADVERRAVADFARGLADRLSRAAADTGGDDGFAAS